MRRMANILFFFDNNDKFSIEVSERDKQTPTNDLTVKTAALSTQDTAD